MLSSEVTGTRNKVCGLGSYDRLKNLIDQSAEGCILLDLNRDLDPV